MYINIIFNNSVILAHIISNTCSCTSVYEKLSLYEKALFSSDLLKAREIMAEEGHGVKRLGREVRG